MDENITRYMEERKDLILSKMLRREDFEEKIKALRAASEVKRYSVISELMDMFELLGIECAEDRDNKYYEELVRSSKLPDFSDVTGQIIRTMYECFEDFPTPEDFMKRIVDRCCCKEDGWNGDPLRLRILKQYIKYGNFSSYTKQDPKRPGKTKTVTVYSGKTYIKKYIAEKTGKASPGTDVILENIDDGIFERFLKEQPANTDLLKLCDNISKGIFKSGSGIKRDLYYFAMIFNMTYTSKNEAASPESIVDFNTDAEKNLFEDYYANNLMRFIIKEYDLDDTKMGGFELDPSGYGIDYKNFAEMVYLYYIASPDYTPVEKMGRAEEMIDRLRQLPPKQSGGDSGTLFIEYKFAKANATELSEEEFERFIAENYDCGDKGIKKLTEQKTAASVLQELTENLDLESCGQGLWFTEWNKKEEKESGNIRSYLPECDEEKLNKFINLIYSIERYLSDSRKLADPDPSTVTRTLIVTAYYYKYMAEETEKTTGPKSFIDIYNDFTNTYTGLNYYLEEAGYKAVSSKNIFDTAVMFGAYLYLNLYSGNKKKMRVLRD